MPGDGKGRARLCIRNCSRLLSLFFICSTEPTRDFLMMMCETQAAKGEPIAHQRYPPIVLSCWGRCGHLCILPGVNEASTICPSSPTTGSPSPFPLHRLLAVSYHCLSALSSMRSTQATVEGFQKIGLSAGEGEDMLRRSVQILREARDQAVYIYTHTA